MKSHKSWLWVGLVAFALRLIWWCVVMLTTGESGLYLFDSITYEHFATVFAEHGQMAYHQPQTGELYPIHNYTPGYPFFFYLLLKTGLGKLGVIFAQLLLSVWSVWMSMALAREFNLSRKAEVWVGLLVAVDLPAIVFSSLLMSESLFTALFLTSCVFFVRSWRGEKKLLELALAGALLGVAILVRPVVQYLPAILVLLLIIKYAADWKKHIGWLLFAFAMLAPLAPWVLRNEEVFGQPVVSTMASTNLFQFHAAAVHSEANGIPLNEVMAANRQRMQEVKTQVRSERGKRSDFTELDWLDELRSEAVDTIMAHPLLYLKIRAYGTGRLLVAPTRGPIEMQMSGGYSESLNVRLEPNEKMEKSSVATTILVIWQCLFIGVIWLLVLAGIRNYRKAGWKHLMWFCILVVLYFCLVASGPETDARFRIPFFPFLALLAVGGIVKPRRLHQDGGEQLDRSES